MDLKRRPSSRRKLALRPKRLGGNRRRARVRVEGINAPELRATVAQIYGRTCKSWYLKINPVWWFMNDDEQTVDHADWYHPEWPYWRRCLYWNVFRNPLQNFRAYVVGASDKNYWVRGREPVMTVQRNDLVPPEYGYQWCVLYGGELWVPRLFLSYSGESFVWYVGHQPSGFWGVKFNLSPRARIRLDGDSR